MVRDNTEQAAPFRPIGLRLVRMVVMVGVISAITMIVLQTMYSIHNAQVTFDAQVREISRTRLPMLSSALWDIEPRLAQAQIDDIAEMPQIAGVTLVTAAGIDMQAGTVPPERATGAADATLDVMPPVPGTAALGRLFIKFDHNYLIRRVLVDTAMTTAFIGLFTALLCILLIRFLRAEVSIPLQRLLAHVNAMSPDAPGVPYDSGRTARPWCDELDQLAEGFSHLHGSIVRYVDERNRAEEALAEQRDQLEVKVAERTCDLEDARDKADQASRSKSEFLANMSHEIRTPINAIAGFTTLALRTELTPKQADYLNKISSATQGLLRIISDLLDFSKIEAGHLDMEYIPFRLSEVMDTMVNYVGPLAEHKGLELLIKVSADMPPQWKGDPLRVGQVLANLCSNAVKFTERGEVEVSVTLKTKTESTGRLLVSVRDTGIGLSPEQAGKLFQAFTQADTSTTRKFGGTGLGLVICQRLVSMMNGRIWLESEDGVGTTFYVEIELGVVPAAQAPQLPRLPPELAGKRALVVDDNANARQILSAQLVELGMEPHAVDSGQAALAELRQASREGYQYPLVLMDWKMPGLDGIATTRAIRSDRSIAGTPVIIMVTAYAREQVVNATDGAQLLDNILLKPVTACLLAETLCRTSSAELPRTGVMHATSRLGRLPGTRVLLVEDNPVNQQLARELLEMEGVQIFIADNGRIALNRLQEMGMTYFDAILLDLQMPEMDGYETARRIRLLPDNASLPVIAMTAHAMSEERERCLALGMQDHLAKPIDPELLVSKLMRWIGADNLARAALRATPIEKVKPQATMIESIPGIDMQAALQRCGGNAALMQDLLRMFQSHYGDAGERMSELCAAGRVKDAFHLAHTIKGAAANMAMTDLVKAATALEHTLREMIDAKPDAQLASAHVETGEKHDKV